MQAMHAGVCSNALAAVAPAALVTTRMALVAVTSGGSGLFGGGSGGGRAEYGGLACGCIRWAIALPLNWCTC
jgi:hypothetical protein